jgi:hypothetical protein
MKLKGTASSIDTQPTVASQLPAMSKRFSTPSATMKHLHICVASQHNIDKDFSQLHYLQRKELLRVDTAT